MCAGMDLTEQGVLSMSLSKVGGRFPLIGRDSQLKCGQNDCRDSGHDSFEHLEIVISLEPVTLLVCLDLISLSTMTMEISYDWQKVSKLEEEKEKSKSGVDC